MDLYHIYFKRDHIFQCLSSLGDIGVCEFRDINREGFILSRLKAPQILRCIDLETKIAYLLKDITENGIELKPVQHKVFIRTSGELSTIEDRVRTMHKKLTEVNENCEELKADLLELQHAQQVILIAQQFLEDFPLLENISNLTMLKNDLQPSYALKFLTGIISREKAISFERVLWRICYGNIYIRVTPVDIPYENDPIKKIPQLKSVFFVFLQGSNLEDRVYKVCQGFNAVVFGCPEHPNSRMKMLAHIKSHMKDIKKILESSMSCRRNLLVDISKDLLVLKEKVIKMKSIFCIINICDLDVSMKSMIGECWIPHSELANVIKALKEGSKIASSYIPAPIVIPIETNEVPPTYNISNKVTIAFQNIVNAYGVAGYREMSPVPFTVITFPFLFAVMFGDFGHGFIMFIFAYWMINNENESKFKESENEIWSIFFSGRYIIILMGAFSMYTGLIYNDFFSKSMNLFGSSWSCNNLTNAEALTVIDYHILDPSTIDYAKYPYLLGLDPVWQLAENRILIMNSYKMKISIILGVIHMLFGLTLSLCNHISLKHKSLIFCELIPQILFLCCLCLYLSILIIVKWIMYFATNNPTEMMSEYCAPSILITFINMMLLKKIKAQPECLPQMYKNQGTVQKMLLTIALCCVPWMLFAPILYKFKVITKYGREKFGEMFINQCIHTIEYVLGTISHTASYLRLWALSLAHAQLSDVLWKRVLKSGFMFQRWYGGVWLAFTFAGWVLLTVSVLIVMEGLSAFLHTLRLHWVEFQSKFYKGNGRNFQPFNFEDKAMEIDEYLRVTQAHINSDLYYYEDLNVIVV